MVTAAPVRATAVPLRHDKPEKRQKAALAKRCQGRF
jgi:hypothetical protein